MADAPEVHIGENSPYQVAYKLTREIFSLVEDKALSEITRKEYLDTYAQCLDAVLGNVVSYS